ncbi:cytochrome c3 family protein [Marinobacter sp. CHS3-4]|uniref:cytochrome c3 family protein n=1 Tax=Marinobacter sp. CHS3-4 TaxID=3045174 RepID=UPI0024B606E7|nr:cytochrome c3 family protein [Marinobacter sp. CHS3-4]MDI9245947.1 cytochrome c3 family protein [Marinobacter sp. CHS3-4]
MRHEDDFGFRNSQYERPNQKWVCGRQADGQGCNIGPDGKGQCQALSECEPFKEGDRWHCNRPFTSGGKCEQGPLANGQCCLSRPPCKPKLSKRVIRGRIVMSASVLGLLIFASLFLMGSDNVFFSPGQLTSSHANIDSCQDCHGEATVFSSGHSNELTQQCADCHEFSEAPLQAHNMRFTDTLDETVSLQSQHQCQTCHQEHEGEAALNMTTAGKSCASCHTDVLEFPGSHPGLGDVAARPVSERALAFNHSTHANKYFPDQNQSEFECAQCHKPEAQAMGNDFAVQPFDQSCGDCHQSDVTGEFFDGGLVLWSVPAIDEARLGAGQELPEAVYDEQAFVSPAQAWLLNKLGDPPENLKAMVNFDLDPLDTSEFTAIQNQQVEYFVRESRQLLNALQAPNSRPQATDPAVEAMLAQLNPKQMQTADAYWFDDQPLPDDAPYYSQLNEGGTYLRGFTLRYRPSGHSDPLFKALIEDLVTGEKNAVNELLLKDLLSEEMAGQCGRCHQVNRDMADNSNIWQPASHQKPLTRFEHRPHMQPLSDQQCVDCHQAELDDAEHDFQQIEVQECGTCHQPEKVGNDCLQCHQYHAHPKTES